MINLYPTTVEAVDEDNNVLFTLTMEDKFCCTMTVKHLLLSNGNLEEVLDAVRQAVKMLELD